MAAPPIGGLERISLDAGMFYRGITPLRLGPKVRKVLSHFFEHEGQVVQPSTLRELYPVVNHKDPFATVRRNVLHIRQILEPDPVTPNYIRTHGKFGYIFTADGRDATVLGENIDGVHMRDEVKCFYVGGRQIPLSPVEYAVLSVLYNNPGAYLTTQHIVDDMPIEFDYRNRTIEEATEITKVAVSRIRAKIERNPHCPQHLLSRRGHGYALNMDGSRLGHMLTPTSSLQSRT